MKYFSADGAPSGTSTEIRWVERNIEQVLVMFPNIQPNLIAYDLSRTRNVEATIEKLLSGQMLPSPPRDSHFSTWGASTAQATASTTSNDVSAKEDLIKRYNLQSKVDTNPVQTQSYQWSKDRAQREALLKARKEEAILVARHKLLNRE